MGSFDLPSFCQCLWDLGLCPYIGPFTHTNGHYCRAFAYANTDAVCGAVL